MRLKLRHVTTYTYSSPAAGAMQILRLTPRNHIGQFVRSWRIETDVDALLKRDEDAYGNITHDFNVEGPITSMQIIVDGEIETHDQNGHVAGAIERFPAAYWLRPTNLTGSDGAIRDLAQSCLQGEGGETLAALHAIMAALNRDIQFVIGDTTHSTSAREAFAAGKGVCQDLAQIFISAARAIGVPARYIAGYYMRTDVIEQEAGHAWAEAHVDGLGWIGFDPANGICVNERHLRISTGLDALEGSPVRGARTGGGSETLDVQVRVEQGRMMAQD